MARITFVFTVWVGMISSATVEATQAKEKVLEASLDLVPPMSPDTRVVEKKSPIKRVVNLLQKMRSELQAEAEKEGELYDKMVCWCETNEKEKNKAIADANYKEKELVAVIEGGSAKFGEAETQVASLKTEIKEETAALKEGTSIREKEAASFRADEKDSVQAMTNLRNAVAVLSKHQGGSFLQLDAPLLSSVRTILRDVALKYEMLLGDTPRVPFRVALLALGAKTERMTTQAQGVTRTLLSALDSHSASVSDGLPLKFAEQFLAKAVKSVSTDPTGAVFLQKPASYSPQSNEIFGIMKQMLAEFEAKQATAQKDEVKAKQDFDALAGAKGEQISTSKSKLDELEGDHAANIKALSDAKEDLDLTRKQRTEDVEFLRNLGVTCQDLDSQWKIRSNSRTEEMKAVSEAITILTEDDSVVGRTVAFLQERSEGGSTSSQRSQVADALRSAAEDPMFDADELLSAWHGRRNTPSVAAVGPRAQLSALAVTVQIDAFTKVKAAMDKMVAQLDDEQKEEVKFAAYCLKELDANEKGTYKKNEEKEDLEATMGQLSSLLKTLAKELEDAKAQIAETQIAIKQASQDREEENKEFQSTVADSRATEDILKKALARLQSFYKKDSFLQRRQAPPVQFNEHKKNAGASPVMGLIEQIIEDSNRLVSEATAGEASAQKNYEKFVKDSKKLIDNLSDEVTSKTKASADAKLDFESGKGDHESAVAKLESLASYLNDLHGECDFVLKNFQVRQKARYEEMGAIRAAKAIMSGEKAL